MSTNISSSVVTPGPTLHASHDPSAAPALESHERSRASGVSPSHALPICPSAQCVGTHEEIALAGTRDLRFTVLGSVNPLSYNAQYVRVRSASTDVAPPSCNAGLNERMIGSTYV